MLKQSNADNKYGPGWSKKPYIITQQVQLFPIVQLTHWGFYANEGSIVFSSRPPDGGSGWKENKLLQVY